MSEDEVSFDSAKAQKIRNKFKELLKKTNTEIPRPQDVKALSDLLHDNQSLELWRMVYSAGQFAEHTILRMLLPSLESRNAGTEANFVEKGTGVCRIAHV